MMRGYANVNIDKRVSPQLCKAAPNKLHYSTKLPLVIPNIININSRTGMGMGTGTGTKTGTDRINNYSIIN